MQAPWLRASIVWSRWPGAYSGAAPWPSCVAGALGSPALAMMADSPAAIGSSAMAAAAPALLVTMPDKDAPAALPRAWPVESQVKASVRCAGAVAVSVRT
jgi:hypothetical protein